MTKSILYALIGIPLVAVLALVQCGPTLPKPLGTPPPPPASNPAVIDTSNFDRSPVRLVDPDATPETVSLFAYLKNIAPDHLLFGHQLSTVLGFSVERKDGTESDVLQAVGAFPAVYGWDALTISGQGETDYDLARAMKAAHANGGINTLSAHMFNFVSGGDFWDTTVAVPHILPGGSHHAAYLAYLNQVADFALNLKDDAGHPIPIIFRPFHENTASHFWWGASFCTADEYRLLFRSTVEYLRDVRAVHSFLYQYSPSTHYQSEEDFLSRYPGDAYVDILGVDGYDTDLTGDWIDRLVNDARIAARLADQRDKVATIAETGPSANGLDATGNPNKKWFSERFLRTLWEDPEARRVAYMLVWRNASTKHFWVPFRDHPELGDHEMLDDFVAFYEHPATVFNDRLDGVYSLDVKTAPSPPLTYIAFPLTNQRVQGNYEVRVKAEGYDVPVREVVLSTPTGRLPMTLRDGYYRANWDTTRLAPGKRQVVRVTARYANGVVKRVETTATPSERVLARWGFDEDIEGLREDGSYVAAGSATATLEHSASVGGGAAMLRTHLEDDGVNGNFTYQELRAKLTKLPPSVASGRINKVRFDILIPQSDTSFLMATGVRFYASNREHLDFTAPEIWTHDLPVEAFGDSQYVRYSADIALGDVRRTSAMAIQLITKDVDYDGPVYLDNLELIEALVDPPLDPAVVDTFDDYENATTPLTELYARHAGGNLVQLSLDRQHKSAGQFGLRFHYGLGSPDYAGVTKRLPSVDWRGYQRFELWFEPDSRQQNLVIQVMASGTAYEVWLPMNGLERGTLKVPFTSLKRPRWAPDAGAPMPHQDLATVSAFSLFVNATPGSELDPFESDLYFDEIRVAKD